MPLPADTLFVNAAKHYYTGTKDDYDCYIANYHDQGLIPLKQWLETRLLIQLSVWILLELHRGMVQLFDIAGKNLADCSGMLAAIKSVL